MGDLKLKNINKSFDTTHVIKDVNLHIKDGEFVVFVGPSGCGKSTILRMVAGLEDISSGDLLINDEVVNDKTPAQRGIAMVFQSYALYPHMSVRHNLSFGLENLKLPKEEIDVKVNMVAEMLAIKEYLDRKPKALSGGQRQRVAIGRAIVRDPQLFLFDEPLSNLDAKLRVQTRNEISKLHQELKTTMIYVTHDQIEAMTMAERIVVLRDGYVEQFDTPLNIFNNPINIFVAGFIGSPQMNMYPGKVKNVDENTITIDLGPMNIVKLDSKKFMASENQDVIVGIRPSHIKLVGGTVRDVLSAQISHVEKMGNETFIYIHHDDIEDNTIIHYGEHIDVKASDKVMFELPKDNCHLFDAQTTLSLRR